MSWEDFVFKPKTPNKDNIIIPETTPFENQYKGEVAFDKRGKMIKLPKVPGAEITDEIPKSLDPEYRFKISENHFYLFTVDGIPMYEQCDNLGEALNMAIQDLELKNKRVKVVGIQNKFHVFVYHERDIGKLWEKARRIKSKRERHKIILSGELSL